MTVRRGSAILGVLILVLILSALSGTYLQVALSEYKESHRTVNLQAAMNVAEAGAEEAIYAILNNNWSGWNQVAPGYYYRRFPNVSYFGDVSQTEVFVNYTSTNTPIMLCQGTVRGPFGNINKQVRIDLGRRGLFANGLTARDSVTFSGTNVKVDSYNSGNGAYDPLFNRNDRGTVGSLSVAVASVDIQNADVFGFIATGGGAPRVGVQGSVTGKDTPPGQKIDANRISTDFFADFVLIGAPSLPGAATSISSNIIGNPNSAPETYVLSSLDVKSTETLNINGPVIIVVTGNVDIKGTVNVNNHGSLTMYVAGDVTVGGNGMLNMTNVPANMVLFGTNATENGQEIKLHGNGAFSGAVYAPNAELNLKGGGNSGVLFGAAVAYEIVIVGNYEFHYDEALDDFNTRREFRITRWRELVDADERAPFATPTLLVGFVQAL
jgi:hypothetical protein